MNKVHIIRIKNNMVSANKRKTSSDILNLSSSLGEIHIYVRHFQKVNNNNRYSYSN